MVSRRRDGARALYRISDPSLLALCEDVCAGVLRELHALIDEPATQEAVR
jgi:hypothetical protein